MEKIKQRNWDDNPRGFFKAYFDAKYNAGYFFISPISNTFSFFSYNKAEGIIEESLSINKDTIVLFARLAYDKLNGEDNNLWKFEKKEVE